MTPLWKQEQRLDYLESIRSPTTLLERILLGIGIAWVLIVSVAVTAVSMWLW